MLGADGEVLVANNLRSFIEIDQCRVEQLEDIALEGDEKALIRLAFSSAAENAVIASIAQLAVPPVFIVVDLL